MPVSTLIEPSEFALTPALTAFIFLEGLFVLVGLGLLLRHPKQAVLRLLGVAPSRLTPSPYRASEIFLAAAFAAAGAIILQFIFIGVASQHWPAPADGSMGLFHVFVAAGFQLGLIAGLAHAWFWHLRKRPAFLIDSTPPSAVPVPPTAPPSSENAALDTVLGGFRAFLVVLPLVWLASFLWQRALDALGVEAPPQDIILLFAQRGDTVALVAMSIFAIVVAPVAEELIFRIGLFRWLRGRIARGLVLLLPAIAFAALHGSISVLVPLMVLSIGFALAYERTGRPGVPILAHAFFNLNTLALIFVGAPTTDAEFRSVLRQLFSFFN